MEATTIYQGMNFLDLPAITDAFVQDTRPTTALLLVSTPNGHGEPQRLALVKPAKTNVPAEAWNVVQGGLVQNELLRDSIDRIVLTELPGTVLNPENAIRLGVRDNQLPEDRGGINKIMHWCVIPVVKFGKPDGTKNADITFVQSTTALKSALVAAREEKQQQILSMVEVARNIGHLNWKD